MFLMCERLILWFEYMWVCVSLCTSFFWVVFNFLANGCILKTISVKNSNAYFIIWYALYSRPEKNRKHCQLFIILVCNVFNCWKFQNFVCLFLFCLPLFECDVPDRVVDCRFQISNFKCYDCISFDEYQSFSTVVFE